MTGSLGIELPTITDEDIAWSCELLNLPEGAFGSSQSGDPRAEILRSLSTLDIEACPGSGKTTLLVAKLAILAKKWPYRSQGICVLSHTNTARREIERRLGSCREGQRLLAYPHFVGTIHGFFNEFLAMPWLRSKPLPVRIVDDDVCQARRWNRLPFRLRRQMEAQGRDQTCMRITGTDFGVRIPWGRGILTDPSSEAYRDIRAACKEVTEEGFHCYDEMFLWAGELLDMVPCVKGSIRSRFPILFIDEVQDNREVQSALLYRLFVEGPCPVVRQRFGDSNQAIYDYAGQSGASMDVFPNASVRRDMPSSYRFGQEIANLADSFAANPQGLVGGGPSAKGIAADTRGRNAILLFSDGTMQKVLEAYSRYLQEVFTDAELRRGTFYAVGGVHKPRGADHAPWSVEHYWPEYDHEITRSEPKPQTFLQYLVLGRNLAHSSGETSHLVERIAEGALHLARLHKPAMDLPQRRRKHRLVLDLLSENEVTRSEYLALIERMVLRDAVPSREEWSGRWSQVVSEVACAISGSSRAVNQETDFLSWQLPDRPDTEQTMSRERDNVFRYPAIGPKVQVRVGSIHSVKGQTHTATLVMDTYYHAHHLKALKAWLLGQKVGGDGEKDRTLGRLRLHYVAMTRPSHLLCLAMREDAFTQRELARLMETIWRVGRVTEEGIAWL